MVVTPDTYSESSRYMAQFANHAMKRKAAGEDDDNVPSGRHFKRSRSGCFTCRLRRKKCDEGRPSCGACISLNVTCEYQQPNWWSSAELRVLQKGKVKDDIKQNKVIVKNNHAFLGRNANSTSPMDSDFTFHNSYPSAGDNPYLQPNFQSTSYGQPQQLQQQPQIFQSTFYGEHQQLQLPLPQMQLQPPQLEFPLPLPQIQQQQFPESQLQFQPWQPLPPIQLQQFPEPQLQFQPSQPLPQIQIQPPQPEPQLQQEQGQGQGQGQQIQWQLQQELEKQEQKLRELDSMEWKLQEKMKQQERQKQEQKQREQEKQKQKQKQQQEKQKQQKQKQPEQQKQKQKQQQEKGKQKQQQQQDKGKQKQQDQQDKGKQKQQDQQDKGKQKQQDQQDKGKQKQQEQPLYEVDVTTERQLFINDVEARKDTSVTTFSTDMPPPAFPASAYLRGNDRTPSPSTDTEVPGYPGPGPIPDPDAECDNFPEQTERELEEISIILDNDGPLLCHFIDNVLRLFFPVSEAHQGMEDEQRIRAILDSLEHNQSYFHCCLSVAAAHLKSKIRLKGKGINSDILRHRFEAVSTLCDAFRKNDDYDRILDSTLAMIIFHCAVASPEEDKLPDIAWYHHFKAATDLLERLDFLDPAATIHHINPPFSASLATWVDILGATMLGRAPHFAQTYRVKYAEGTPSGLCQLMGCDDRVMYIISEIACLDAAQLQGNVNEIAVCATIASLGRQLENTEPRDPRLEHPYNPTTGEVRGQYVIKTITAIFRIAARIYLCSLVPGFDRHQESNLNLVEAGTRALDYLPDGPNGYDRCIVWPLLIIGTFSVPKSSIRMLIHRRMIEMGDDNQFGNWHRLYRVLLEIWRRGDSRIITQTAADGTQITTQTRPQNVDWRMVLIENHWDYLLI